MIRSSRATWLLVIPLVAALVTGLSAFGRLQTSQPGLSDRLEVPADGTVVAMDDLSGRPLVPVWINGQGPFLFIVSTSALVTGLTQDLVNELGLAQDSDELGRGPITLQDLRVGDTVAKRVTVNRTVVVNSPGEPAVRGVLSASSFPGALFALDYPGAKLRVQMGSLPPSDGRRVFQYSVDDAVPVVPVDIAGHSFDVPVDSNAPGALTLPTRDLTDLPLADAPVRIGHVFDGLGALPVSVATLNGIVTIGDFPLEIHSVIICDLRSFPGAPSGSIGARILEGFVVTIDAQNHRIRLDR